MGNGIKVIVATHKPYSFPDGDFYAPVQVGAALKGRLHQMEHDDAGENISEKNGSYCELTALYWAWKNHFFEESGYAGLVHYRRYFKGNYLFRGKRILGEDDIRRLMERCDIIVPIKRHYYIESVYGHYKHAHYQKDIDTTGEIISAYAPEYAQAFDMVMRRRSLHLYNMFLMRSELAYRYCEWLFPLLERIEQQSDITGYDSYQKRVFGFLGERLFNVWIIKHGYKICEQGVVNLEGENLVKKGILMIKRKFL